MDSTTKMAESGEFGSVRKRSSPASENPTSTSFQNDQNQNQRENEFSQQCSSMAEYYERLRRWIFMYKSHTYMQQHMMFMMPYVTFTSYLQQQQQQMAGTGTTRSQSSGGVMSGQPTPAAQQLPAQNQQIQNDIRLAHGVQNQQNVAQNGNIIPQIAGRCHNYDLQNVFKLKLS